MTDDPSEKNKKNGTDKDTDAEAQEVKRKDEPGYELSRREKVWKEQMEAMRKRIEQDPYEAVFGKRFEPFWSPLVPSWMREEMGLPRRSKAKGKDEETAKEEPEKKQREEKTAQQQHETKPAETEPEPVKEEDVVVDVKIQTEPEQKQSSKPQSYSYASSTSWDSWTNKTRRVEWDSVSGQTKKFEYDPISNRMVSIEAPSTAAAAETNKAEIEKPETAPRTSPDAPEAVSAVEKTNSIVKLEENGSADAKAMNIPIQQSSTDTRKSIPIPIPPPLSQPSQGIPIPIPIPIGFAPATVQTTSVGPVKSTAISSPTPPSTAAAAFKPTAEAVAKLPETESEPVDRLTASSIRASMGKTGKTKSSPADKDTAPQTEKAGSESDMAHRGRMHGNPLATEWDQAEMVVLLEKELEGLRKKREKLIRDERGLFHIERLKQEASKLEERMGMVAKQIEGFNGAASEKEPLQTSLQRAERETAKVESASALQSSLERMQSKDLPQISATEPDDAAAHESTEPIESAAASRNVPKDWSKQADLLQADRVRRTASKKPYGMPAGTTKRWIDDMQARKDAFDARLAQQKATDKAANVEKNAKLEKANAMLEAEVQEQKWRMQAHENRYAHKIRSLRQELETAYKQSTVHSEKHVERIRELEGKVEQVESGQGVQAGKYKEKIGSLRGELETAYKQSAVHSDKHLERIKYLEQELEKANKAVGEKKPRSTSSESATGPLQGEGDFCPSITRYADSGKWYKHPASTSAEPKLTQREIEKAEQKLRDQKLVREVREIYEKSYGVIDTNHRQPEPVKAQTVKAAAVAKRSKPQVVEVESDVDLGEALAKYEKEQPLAYRFQPQPQRDGGLEAELAKQEREAHEGQGHAMKDWSDRLMKPRIWDLSVGASRLAEENGSANLVNDAVPKLIPTETAKPATPSPVAAEISSKDLVSPTIRWQDPPIYKVLAYDSGNDMMSTATTTSNFSGAEKPISIPQALSQLYQPARFVPHFAELQREGYQVIFGTKDLLVFRKVKPEVAEAAAEEVEGGIEDHGLVGGIGAKKEVDDLREKLRGEVNPVDGTTRRPEHVVEPQTGNFASPTGFVNLDPIFAHERSSGIQERRTMSDVKMDGGEEAGPRSSTAHQQEEDEVDWRHYPRVRREEQHFTGTNRKWSADLRRHERQQRKQDKRERRLKGKMRKKSSWRWMLGAGFGTAGVMYLVGAAAEKAREAKEGDWAGRAEERRR